MPSVSAICALLSALTCLAAAGIMADSYNTTEQLKVGVYYEVLCPDSVRFIRQHLYPCMVVDGLLQYAELQLVPYGKATTWTNPLTNQTMLSCQHGTAECELNALHACIVEHNPVMDQLHLINCLMRGHSSTLDECAQQLKINVQQAKLCKDTRPTTDILDHYGKLTDVLEISYVPTITIDEEFKPFQQQRLNRNFRETFRREYQKKFGRTIDLR